MQTLPDYDADRFVMVDWLGGNDTGPWRRKDAVWLINACELRMSGRCNWAAGWWQGPA